MMTSKIHGRGKKKIKIFSHWQQLATIGTVGA
jgi:hypothetical protein